MVAGYDLSTRGRWYGPVTCNELEGPEGEFSGGLHHGEWFHVNAQVPMFGHAAFCNTRSALIPVGLTCSITATE